MRCVLFPSTFHRLTYAKSFLFVSFLVATLLQFITIMLFHRVGINHISLGPMAVLFSILYQYSRIIPPAYTYRVFGIPLNNKSMNYILAIQVSVHPTCISWFMEMHGDIKQFAISRPLGSVAVAIIGILTGQIYRSDLAGLNAYRLPPTIIWLSKGFIAPVIGSLRPPRRSDRALPDDFRNTSRIGELSTTTQNEEVITTARSPGSLVGRARGGESEEEQQRPAPSVMREWVEELTRRDHANAGLRVPSESEITHLTSMFPSLDREVVVGALQRR